MRLLYLPIVFLMLLFSVGCKKDNPGPGTPPPPPPQLPYADFNISNNFCTAPCTVTFTNTSTDATAFSWSFGPVGATSTSTNPTYRYQNAGTYTVSLTAFNANGSNSTSRTVFVYENTSPPPPPCQTNNTAEINVIITSNNPYMFYVDNQYYGDISGNGSRRFTVPAGFRTVKVIQKSGYLFTPTERTSSSTLDACQRYTWTPAL